MLSVREVGLVAQREALRNLRSTKGIAMFALFFLGGLVPAVVRLALARLTTGVPDEAVREGFEKYLASRYDSEAVAKFVVDAPRILYFLYEGTLMFLPLLILLVGFDQIAGEVQHRTLRYSAGRASRASIVAGKALGMWAVIAVMATVLHATVWIVTLAQGGQALGPALSWGVRLLFLSACAAAAYVGFASLMSSLFRTPIVALFSGIGTGFVLWLLYTLLGVVKGGAEYAKDHPNAAWHVSEGMGKVADALAWGFPNRYEKLLLQPDPLMALGGVGLLFLWGALCVAGSAAIVARRDI